MSDSDKNAAAAKSETCVDPSNNQEGGEKTKKLKACCACPETKKARDECIMQLGEEYCKPLIEAHKKCMRDHGFKI